MCLGLSAKSYVWCDNGTRAIARAYLFPLQTRSDWAARSFLVHRENRAASCGSRCAPLIASSRDARPSGKRKSEAGGCELPWMRLLGNEGLTSPQGRHETDRDLAGVIVEVMTLSWEAGGAKTWAADPADVDQRDHVRECGSALDTWPESDHGRLWPEKRRAGEHHRRILFLPGLHQCHLVAGHQRDRGDWFVLLLRGEYLSFFLLSFLFFVSAEYQSSSSHMQKTHYRKSQARVCTGDV